MMLVTLDQVKTQLRVDDDAEDDDLTLRIHAASGMVVNYLKKPTFIDDDGNLDEDAIPYEVKLSVLLLVGYLYRNRDEDPGAEFSLGMLPNYVTALIYQLRDPALA